MNLIYSTSPALKAVFIDPWPWWAGGLAIGLIVPALYLVANKGVGASSGYGSILRLLPGPSRLKWVADNFRERLDWKFYLLVGMALGGFLSARLMGRPLATTDMGYLTAPGSVLPPALVPVVLFTGGFLLAFGARTAGGCTSGHSIHGMATLQVSGLIASAAFFAAGIMVTWLAVRPLLGGQ